MNQGWARAATLTEVGYRIRKRSGESESSWRMDQISLK